MFKPYEYFKTLAEQHKEILHTDNNCRIFRISGIAGIEELLGQQTDMEFPAVLVEVNDDGTIGDESQSDNYLDKPSHPFFIIDRAEPGDDDALEASRQRTKRIGFEFIARMRHERYGTDDPKNPLLFLDFSNIPYQTIGPFGDSITGCMFTLRFNQVSDYFKYNSEKWQTTQT